LIKNMLGIHVRIVTGYSGSAEERLAMERREIDGQCGSWSSTPVDWVQNHKVDLLVRFSPEASADMPDAPFIGDLAKTDTDRKVLKLFLATATLGRPFVLSRDIPAARLAILRKAFDETMHDAEFLADAKKQKLPIDPVSGAAAQAVIDPLYETMTPEIVAAAKAAIK
jgi:tripartite-type tricarboxylate transporter receptor subunit TctC